MSVKSHTKTESNTSCRSGFDSRATGQRASFRLLSNGMASGTAHRSLKGSQQKGFSVASAASALLLLLQLHTATTRTAAAPPNTGS